MRPQYNYKIKNNLLQLRKARKLSQNALARKVGIAEINYRRIEKGKNVPSGETMLMIAMALKEPVDKVFYLEKII